MKRVATELVDLAMSKRLHVPRDQSPEWASHESGIARWNVASENFRASRSRELDARFMLAEQVARAIEGGQAAILRPERRRALVAAALDMGLRRFDAYLIIAIVQESARRGDVLTLTSLSGQDDRASGRESRRLRARLSMLPTARETGGQHIDMLIMASVMLGVLLLGVMIVLVGP